MQLADYLVHLSNVLMLVSYSVRDILWLRWFAVAAALTVIPYYLAQPNVLWPPVAWGSVFMAINLWQIARIYLERRPVVLSADEQKLYDLGFRALRPREFVSLVLTGEWRDAAPGEKVLEQGKAVEAVCIAIAGEVEFRRQGATLGRLSPGYLIGTALALTGEPAPADAVFVEPARYMRWPLASLRAFADRRPELRAALQRFVNQDLAHKVERLAAAGTDRASGATERGSEVSVWPR
jgi:CRP-like cAMP-binding protein